MKQSILGCIYINLIQILFTMPLRIFWECAFLCYHNRFSRCGCLLYSVLLLYYFFLKDSALFSFFPEDFMGFTKTGLESEELQSIVFFCSYRSITKHEECKSLSALAWVKVLKFSYSWDLGVMAWLRLQQMCLVACTLVHSQNLSTFSSHLSLIIYCILP